jgi:hypothetical protein
LHEATLINVFSLLNLVLLDYNGFITEEPFILLATMFGIGGGEHGSSFSWEIK